MLHTRITEYTWNRLHFIKFVYPHHHHHPLLQLLLAPPSWPWGPVVSAWSVTVLACRQWSSQTPLQTLEPETPITTATVNNGAFKLRQVASSSDSETQSTGHWKCVSLLQMSETIVCHTLVCVFQQYVNELRAFEPQACWRADDHSLYLYFVLNKFFFKPNDWNPVTIQTVLKSISLLCWQCVSFCKRLLKSQSNVHWKCAKLTVF